MPALLEREGSPPGAGDRQLPGVGLAHAEAAAPSASRSRA